jgi:long-chain fatty acid transport protein
MRTPSSLRPSLLATTALALVAATASATDGRYRDFVIGERAGGMGGAAIAVATDVDAIYYNPAGLAHSQGDSISLSANLYGREHHRTKGGLDWGEDDTSDTFVTIPGAMGGVKRLSEEWVAGFGVFAPKQEKRHIIAADSTRTSFNHGDYNDQTLWIGPAISWAPAESRLSLGAGLFAVYRDCSISQSSFQTGVASVNGAIDLTVLGLLASAGAQYDLGDGWSVGATVQTPSVRVWDDGTLSVNGVDSEFGDYPVFGIYSTDVKADNYIPWQLAVGVGRTVPGVWGFGLDAIYHPSRTFDLMRWNIHGVPVSQSIRLHSVLDVSLGGEYVVAERYPIRAGFYTALSSIRVPDDPDSTDFITTDVDMYGVTFSVGRRGDNMSVNFGIDYAFGEGHDLGNGYAGDKSRADCDRHVLLAIVSTTYYF